MFSSPGAVLIQLGPLSIRWYGLLMASAIAIGFWLAYREAQAEDLPADDLLTVAQWAVLAGLVGARIYEVIFSWDYYGQYPAKIIAVWEGGLAIHGGLILGPIVGIWLARRKRLPILRCLDVVSPSIVLGQAIGRWGNFFNEEAFGRPTDLPWKLYISPPHRPPDYGAFEYFHPTFLYESLWDLAVFLALVIWLRPRLPPAAGRALLLLHRPLLDGAPPDRVDPHGQLLGRGLPRRPARQRGRPSGRVRRADMDLAPPRRRGLSFRPLLDAPHRHC